MQECKVLTGYAIVVLDRGFVYVGNVAVDDKWCIVRNARNIRAWGTDKGLGQLALAGPTDKTRLDAVGSVRAPLHSLIHLIDTEAAIWTAK